MPGTPTRVRSCGVRSCRARSKASLHDAELALAPDELGARLVCDVDAEAGVGGDRHPDGDRLGLALGFDRGASA